MVIKKYWTTEEVNWLINNYKTLGREYSSKYLNVTTEQIRHKLGNLKKHNVPLVLAPQDSKVCSTCNNNLPLSCFYKSKKGKFGLHAICKECTKEYDREKYHTDSNRKLIRKVRRQFKPIFSRKAFNETREAVIGCTLEEFKTYIEKQFVNGMSWENYGTGKTSWNLDHIVPVSMIKTNPEKMHLLFNYRNQQPLWELDNSLKSDCLLVAKQHILEKITMFGDDLVYQKLLALVS